MSRLTDALGRNHEREDPARCGLVCPFCQCRSFRVERTGNKVTNQIRRVRVRQGCGKKVKTVEIIQGEK